MPRRFYDARYFYYVLVDRAPDYVHMSGHFWLTTSHQGNQSGSYTATCPTPFDALVKMVTDISMDRDLSEYIIDNEHADVRFMSSSARDSRDITPDGLVFASLLAREEFSERHGRVELVVVINQFDAAVPFGGPCLPSTPPRLPHTRPPSTPPFHSPTRLPSRRH